MPDDNDANVPHNGNAPADGSGGSPQSGGGIPAGSGTGSYHPPPTDSDVPVGDPDQPATLEDFKRREVQLQTRWDQLELAHPPESIDFGILAEQDVIEKELRWVRENILKRLGG